jgi:hypothetical protein
MVGASFDPRICATCTVLKDADLWAILDALLRSWLVVVAC